MILTQQTKPTKTLLIVIWNMGIGGIQKRVRDILISLSNQHPEISVEVLVKHKQPGWFGDDLEALPNVHLTYFSKTYYKPNHLPFIFWILAKYLNIKPDITLTFLDHLSMKMIIIKKLVFWHSSKLVLNEGVLTSRYISLNRPQWWKWLPKLLYRYADLIIAPSDSVKQDLAEHFYVPVEKITVIKNWTLFPKVSYKKKRYDLLFVGRFEAEKNPWGFIHLVESLLPDFPALKSLMIGSGSQYLAIRRYVYQHNLHHAIRFAGTQHHSLLPFLLSKILVLPTLNEGLPNVVLEAGMCAVPTISSDFPGAHEVIQNAHTGLIASTHEELVASAKVLLKNEKKRLAMGTNAQEFVHTRFHTKQQDMFIQKLLEE